MMILMPSMTQLITGRTPKHAPNALQRHFETLLLASACATRVRQVEGLYVQVIRTPLCDAVSYDTSTAVTGFSPFSTHFDPNPDISEVGALLPSDTSFANCALDCLNNYSKLPI